jgi:hypothetical protein
MAEREIKLNSDEIISLLRTEKSTLLPPWGGWVCILGNPYAPRGFRIPTVIRDLGVQHMDIYYAYDEGCPWTVYPNLVNVGEKLSDIIIEKNQIPDVQLTWMALHTPASQLIRMWCGEVRVFRESLIEDMLEANYLATIPFGKTNESPVWDEATRDIIGSLQVDGLSYQEAQFELVTAGVEFEKDLRLPPYFFRAIGEYKNAFCEESEIE